MPPTPCRPRRKTKVTRYKARLDHSCGHSVERPAEAADNPANLEGSWIDVTSRLEAAETNVMREGSKEVIRHDNEDAELMMMGKKS